MVRLLCKKAGHRVSPISYRPDRLAVTCDEHESICVGLEGFGAGFYCFPWNIIALAGEYVKKKYKQVLLTARAITITIEIL